MFQGSIKRQSSNSHSLAAGIEASGNRTNERDTLTHSMPAVHPHGEVAHRDHQRDESAVARRPSDRMHVQELSPEVESNHAQQSCASDVVDHSSLPVPVQDSEANPSSDQHVKQESQESGNEDGATEPLLPLPTPSGSKPITTVMQISAEPYRLYLENEANASAQTQDQQQTIWNPFWLRKRWLISYALTFSVLLATVVTLYLFSNRRNGLVASGGSTGMAYFWKFLPTAIFVALLSLWNPVDYFVRLLQPWKNLSQGPAAASKTLLLDHVSSLQPTILVSAFRNSEWAVILTLVVATALTATKVVSTGLLAVEPTSILAQDASLVRLATFDPNLWNSSERNYEAVSLYSGIRGGNLAQLPWTRADFVAEPFGLPADSTVLQNSIFSALTKSIHPNLLCEEARLTKGPYSVMGGYTFNMTFASTSCETEITKSVLYAHGKEYVFAAKNYVGKVHETTCSNNTAFLIEITQVNSRLGLTDYSALFCRPSFVVKNIAARVDEKGQQHLTTADLAIDQSQQLPHLDPNVVFRHILQASQYAKVPWYKPLGNISEGNVPFLTIAAIPLNISESGGSYLEPFMDANLLNKMVSETFSGAFSVLVAKRMFRSENSTIRGELQYQEDRLHVKKTPTVVVSIILLLCILSTGFLILVAPDGVVPYNPNSVKGIAAIISPAQRQLFTEHSSFPNMVQTLRNYNFRSSTPTPGDEDAPGIQFNIIPSPTTSNGTLDTAAGQEEKKASEAACWCPPTLNSWVRFLAMALCLATIISLEVLQRLSSRPNGIMHVTPDSTARFWITVIPAAILTGITLLHSSIHFNIALMSPYHMLASSSGAPSKRSIATDYLGSTPLFTIWPAINRRHYAAVVSAFAAVIGAFLTIVVSGLYSVEFLETNTAVQLQVNNAWNLTWEVSPCSQCLWTHELSPDPLNGDASASYLLKYMLWGNTSEPLWTFDDLVLPSISGSHSTTVLDGQEKVEVLLPARRAVLDCTATGPAEVLTSIKNSATTIYTKVPRTCSATPVETIDAGIGVSSSQGDYPTYVGDIWELNYRNYSPMVSISNPDSWASRLNGPEWQDCPSVFIAFGLLPNDAFQNQNGSASRNFTSPARNFTAPQSQLTTLACSQKIQEIDTTVTLTLPDFTIDQSQPPLLHEDSMRWLGGVRQYPAVINLREIDVLSANTTFNKEVSNLSNFFAAIIHGKYGIPAGELLGEANIPRLIAAVSKMYGRYMAQVLSRKMRITTPADQQLQPVQATTSKRKLYLLQNSAPKITLQILLGVMMLCGALSWILMPKVRILPHDPCSIAGTAFLLAGQEFWGEGRKDWEDDQMFCLATRDDRFGIYAVGTESRGLVDR